MRNSFVLSYMGDLRWTVSWRKNSKFNCYDKIRLLQGFTKKTKAEVLFPGIDEFQAKIYYLITGQARSEKENEQGRSNFSFIMSRL